MPSNVVRSPNVEIGIGDSNSSKGHVSDVPSAGYMWYVVSLLFLANVLNYMDRMALALLAPLIKQDFALTDAQLGLLVGLAFSLFYAVCGIPIARFADRGVRRNIIAAALALWSAMTAACGAAQSFWHLFAARVGVGIGEAGGLAPAQSIIADLVPLRKRPAIYAVHSLGLWVGMALGLALTGWLGERVGWRQTFVLLGLPGLILAFLIRLTLREPRRGQQEELAAPLISPSVRKAAKILWQCRTYRLILVSNIAAGAVGGGLNQWLPSYYTRTFDVSMTVVGASLGLAAIMGSGFGLLLGGILANRLGRRDVRLPLLVGALAAFLTIFTSFGIIVAPTMSISILFLGVSGFAWNLSSGAATASLYSVVRPEMRATAGALSILCTSILGFGVAPLLVGLLSDALLPTLGVASLRYALVIPILTVPVLVITLFMASRTLVSDLTHVGARL